MVLGKTALFQNTGLDNTITLWNSDTDTSHYNPTAMSVLNTAAGEVAAFGFQARSRGNVGAYYGKTGIVFMAATAPITSSGMAHLRPPGLSLVTEGFRNGREIHTEKITVDSNQFIHLTAMA